MNNSHFTSFAFISYSHRDMAMAKWLQRRLEGFKLPTDVHNDIDAKNRYLRPVFRDQSDLNSGVLGEELRKHLEQSLYLIILCSRNSAQSTWVSDEVRAFVEMGRLEHIIPVIIPDGNSLERELFPEFLRDYFAAHPDKELLGINIGEVGQEKALIRVVSRMLGVSFDSLWKRHQRQKRVRLLTSSAFAAVAVVATYIFAIPVSISINVEMEKAELPNGENVTINIDGGEYFSNPIDPQFENVTIPGYKRFSDLRISVTSQFFVPVDTVLPVGLGLSRDINIKLRRDDTFAIYAGTVYDSEMQSIPEVSVQVCGHKTVTDAEGYFYIKLSLAEQRQERPITLEKIGYKSLSREDEIPSQSLKFILHH